MYKLLHDVPQKFSLLYDSWVESLDFLRSIKTIKQFFTITTRALYQAVCNRVIFLMFLIVSTLIRLNKHDNFGLYFFTMLLMYSIITELRASKVIKDRQYLTRQFEILLPLIILSLFSYLLVINTTLLVTYKLLFFIASSPLLLLYTFFLLDAKWSLRAYFTSLTNAIYFCILNAPAILLSCLLLVLAMWCVYMLFTYISENIFTVIVQYLLTLILFLPYWASLSSLYIKRRFDQFGYYRV